jgi:subtilase family serine protease
VTGVTIAIPLVLNYLTSDVVAFDSAYGLPNPTMLRAFLNGTCSTYPCSYATPNPTNDELEAAVDSQWSHAFAPSATIYGVSGGGLLVTTQILDYEYIVNEIGNEVNIVTSSYGFCEGLQTEYVRSAMDSLADQGALEGQTWVAASGDWGAAGDPPCPEAPLSAQQVDLPASLPDVLAVGGTSVNPYPLPTSGTKSATYHPETIWDDKGLSNSSTNWKSWCGCQGRRCRLLGQTPLAYGHNR